MSEEPTYDLSKILKDLGTLGRIEKTIAGAAISYQWGYELTQEAGLLSWHFADFKAQTVFNTVQELAEKGKTVDLLSVYHELNKAGRLEAVGGMDYLTDCSTVTIAKKTLISHVGRLKAHAGRRKMLEMAILLKESAMNPQVDPVEATEEAVKRAEDIYGLVYAKGF